MAKFVRRVKGLTVFEKWLTPCPGTRHQKWVFSRQIFPAPQTAAQYLTVSGVYLLLLFVVEIFCSFYTTGVWGKRTYFASQVARYNSLFYNVLSACLCWKFWRPFDLSAVKKKHLPDKCSPALIIRYSVPLIWEAGLYLSDFLGGGQSFGSWHPGRDHGTSTWLEGRSQCWSLHPGGSTGGLKSPHLVYAYQKGGHTINWNGSSFLTHDPRDQSHSWPMTHDTWPLHYLI